MLRQKEESFVVIFDTTSQAMAMEKYSKLAGATGRLIPTPPSIRAGCGFAYRCPISEKPLIQTIIAEKNIVIHSATIAMI